MTLSLHGQWACAPRAASEEGETAWKLVPWVIAVSFCQNAIVSRSPNAATFSQRASATSMRSFVAPVKSAA
jgi:hypothetical protein